jgi:hypothetical protein
MFAKRLILILSIFSPLTAAVAFQQSQRPEIESQSSSQTSQANSAHAAASANELVRSQLIGQWVALHRSKEGIASMWEFRPDDTLTMSPGAVVDLRYRLAGDTLTLSPLDGDPPSPVFKVRFEGDRLYQRKPDQADEVTLVRVKPGRPGDAPIIGQWKFDPSVANRRKENAPPLDFIQLKILPELFSEIAAAVLNNTTYTFSRDGICRLRIAFGSVTGRYDLSSRTFSLDLPEETEESKAFTGHFELRNGELYLTQPDGHSQDVYIRDDFESTPETSREKQP